MNENLKSEPKLWSDGGVKCGASNDCTKNLFLFYGCASSLILIEYDTLQWCYLLSFVCQLFTTPNVIVVVNTRLYVGKIKLIFITGEPWWFLM